MLAVKGGGGGGEDAEEEDAEEDTSTRNAIAIAPRPSLTLVEAKQEFRAENRRKKLVCRQGALDIAAYRAGEGAQLLELATTLGLALKLFVND